MHEHAYVVNVDAIVVRDDEYLFIERAESEAHAAGCLAFPGGKVEESEGDRVVERTAVREVREEVGVEVGIVEYLHSNAFETDDGLRCLNVVTLCSYESGRAHPRSRDEVAATHWLTYEDAIDREDLPAFTERFLEIAATRRRGV